MITRLEVRDLDDFTVVIIVTTRYHAIYTQHTEKERSGEDTDIFHRYTCIII